MYCPEKFSTIHNNGQLPDKRVKIKFTLESWSVFRCGVISKVVEIVLNSLH